MLIFNFIQWTTIELVYWFVFSSVLILAWLWVFLLLVLCPLSSSSAAFLTWVGNPKYKVEATTNHRVNVLLCLYSSMPIPLLSCFFCGIIIAPRLFNWSLHWWWWWHGRAVVNDLLCLVIKKYNHSTILLFKKGANESKKGMFKCNGCLNWN